MSFDGQNEAHPRLEFAPAPAGFDLAPMGGVGLAESRASSRNGVRHVLSHAQLDVSASEPVHTHRSLVHVTSNDGIQGAANFSATFNPQFERLIIHRVWVHRNGDIRDAAQVDAFEIIQRELNLERATYDGRRTAHMVIPDVREGDVVETMFSTVGGHPILQGRFSWAFILQWSVPVGETRCTLRVPAALPLTFRSRGVDVPPNERTEADVRTLDWRAIDLPTYTPDARSPPSHVGYASVHVAETMTWPDVADVFSSLYDLDAPFPDSLRAAIGEVVATAPNVEARVTAVLRLVQNSLRYHSVSVGEGGFRPRPLSKIWDTRYGDCKDASLVLAIALRSVGVEAVCALVNTVVGDDLPSQPPSLTAFDHCIVRARLDSGDVWLDPTLPPQAGDLEHLTKASFSWALPLEPGAGLEPMVSMPMADVCDLHEIWTFGKGRFDPAKLDISTTYRSWRADGMRRVFVNEAPDAVASGFREGLERELNSPLSALEVLRLEDNDTDNVLRIVEAYDVERPYRQEETGSRGQYFVSRDDLIGTQLPRIGPDRRREPLQLGFPRQLTTKRTFKFPVPFDLKSTERTIQGPAGLVYTRSYTKTASNRGTLVMTLTIPKGILAASEAADYEEFVRRAEASNGISFPIHFRGGRMVQQGGDAKGIPGWALWGGIVVLIAVARMLMAG